jgi:hypothetical protein
MNARTPPNLRTRGSLTARLRRSVPPAWRTLASPAVEYAAATIGPPAGLRRFVVVCGWRTGSDLLCDLLDSLADVRCQGELLREPRRWPVAYLNGRAALGGIGHRAWGCKVINSHLSLAPPASRPAGDQVLSRLTQQGWTIIHLRRRDVLAQALSCIHAEREQHHYRGEARFEPFAADPAEVIAVLHTLDGHSRWLDDRLAVLPHTTITYEDDLRTPELQRATLGRLAHLLGVPDSGARTDLRPIAPSRPEDRITNRAAVVRALEATRFAPLVRPDAEEG